MAQAALIIGAGMMAASTIQEGIIAEAQGKFAQKIGIQNQLALERQAKAEREAASIEETRVARKEKIISARQRARMGKTGVGLAGASLEFLADTAFQFSMERNLILRRGLIRGQELRWMGRMEYAKGKWAKRLGTQAKRLSYVKAGASILGSAGQAGTMQGGSQLTTLPGQTGVYRQTSWSF
jgi:hypothetical protein